MLRSRLSSACLAIIWMIFFTRPIFSEASLNVHHTVEFSLKEFSFDKLSGYDMVRLEGGSFLADVGKPLLPSKEIRIALPPGMAVKSMEVIQTTSKEISGEFNIFPAQPPRTIAGSDEPSDFVEPDPKIYASAQPYPLKVAKFVHQTDLAGQGLAVVLLYPLQYIPSEKRLLFYTSITLLIQGEEGYECKDYLSPHISAKGERTYEKMVKDMVVNPNDVQLSSTFKAGSSILPDGPFDHVIITSSSFASYFQPLADWHTQKGVKDTVINTGWIYFNYGGSTYQEKIRNFISDAYSSWGTSYFLLGGENETVPFEYRTYYSESTPSDQYYSDFDDDWTHEVFVGRVTVGSSTEINTFINKVLKYEKDPPRTDYPLDILLIGMDYDAYTPGEDLKENIYSYYIPSRFNVTKVYDSDYGNHRTAVINALNAGQNLVNHADHANTTVLGTGDFHHGWGIYNSDVDALYNNDQLSVIVTPGCHPNHMDANDCIAEHFVIWNPNQAGVAFCGNTRNGLYYQGQPFSLSNGLDKQWWVAVFFYGKYNLGQIMVEAKHHFSHSTTDEKHCEWTFNLLGEPEMPIWTDEPDSFEVTHPSMLPPENSSFSVHVEDATTHSSVDSAYVCLWKQGEVYLTGYTDASGDISFNPSPSTVGSMYITVTKHNYLPYQQEVEVAEYITGDANHDGVVDIGDVVYLISYVYRGGPAPIPYEAGDTNCDGMVDLGDIVYLINYLYREGPPPGCP